MDGADVFFIIRSGLSGGTCIIQGSPSNDGNYLYTGATFDTDHTDIFFDGSVVLDGTAGGTILALANSTDIVVVEAIPDTTADGWVQK